MGAFHQEVDDLSRKLKLFTFNDDAHDTEGLITSVRKAVTLSALGFDVTPLFPEMIKVHWHKWIRWLSLRRLPVRGTLYRRGCATCFYLNMLQYKEIPPYCLSTRSRRTVPIPIPSSEVWRCAPSAP